MPEELSWAGHSNPARKTHVPLAKTAIRIYRIGSRKVKRKNKS
jgi:hypothetical protein